MFWAGSLAVAPASLTNNSGASGRSCPTGRFGLPRVPDASKGLADSCKEGARNAKATEGEKWRPGRSWESRSHCHLPATIIERQQRRPCFEVSTIRFREECYIHKYCTPISACASA